MVIRTADRRATDSPARAPLPQPGSATVAIIASMLGLAVGLLASLIARPSSLEADVLAPQSAGMSLSSVAWPTWPSEFSINGGEMIVVVATTAPTAWPTPTRGVVLTSTPRLPDCSTPVPGRMCEWSFPSPTPTAPPPVCETPEPGWACVWPTPTTAPLPKPPEGVGDRAE